MLHLISAMMLAFTISAPESPATGIDHFPRNYKAVVYQDWDTDSLDQPGHEKISVLQGNAQKLEQKNAPFTKVIADDDRVEVTFSGLDRSTRYIVAFDWWNGDHPDQRASVCFSGFEEPVLPATVPAAFYKDQSTRARVLLPLPAKAIHGGKAVVTFFNENGPGVLLGRIWLLKQFAPDAKKRVLIITGDDYPGHLWRETAPEIAAILREDPRLEVSITEAPGILASPLLSQYDALVMHFKNYEDRLPLGEKARKGLKNYIDNPDHGLFFTHFSCGALQDWPGFVEIAGRIWNPELRGHDPHGSFTVTVSDRNHHATENLDDFETTDELYTCLDGDTPIHILCQAESKVDGKQYPMLFTCPDQKGRVIHSPLGHDVRALKTREVRYLFLNSVQWAVNLPLSLWILPATRPVYEWSTKDLDQQLHIFQQKMNSSQDRVIRLASLSRGTPYADGPLGEGPDGKYDTDPLMDLTKVDCVTFIEQTLALAASSSYQEAFDTLQKIRYRDGIISYETRNHFMVADWLENNPWCVDATADCGAELKALTRTISKRDFFKLVKAPELGQDIPDREITIHYLPTETCVAVEDKLPAPAIVLFIGKKPDWIFTLHTGFLFRTKSETEKAVLVHASSKAGEVTTTPLLEYLEEQKDRYLGILVCRFTSLPGLMPEP